MSIDDGKKQTDAFIAAAEQHGDRFLVAHFSKEEDKYLARHNLDAGDALIVIHKLIDEFGLEPEAIV
jgi:hypothetical protein